MVAAQAPRVSVVMGVYNAERTIDRTIESLTSQSMDDFELIIVDDGSTDRTAEVIQQHGSDDRRIQIYRQPNAGLTKALIQGCGRARGDLIARIDAGDQAFPSRFDKQVTFLDEHPEVVAVGTGVRRIGPNDELLGDSVQFLGPDQFTAQFLTRGVGLCHPSTMFRSQAYRNAGGYRPQFRFAQDTDLWYRLTRQGLIGEISEPLLKLRIDVEGISPLNSGRQKRLAELAYQSYRLIDSGQSDERVLVDAQEASWGTMPVDRLYSADSAKATAEFFIGSQLYTRGDGRCRQYLINAIRHRPLWLRSWVKLVLSYLKMQRNNG